MFRWRPTIINVDAMQAALNAKLFEGGTTPMPGLEKTNAVVAINQTMDYNGLIDEIAWRGRGSKGGQSHDAAQEPKRDPRHVVPHR